MRKKQVVVRRSSAGSAEPMSSTSSLAFGYGECRKNHAASLGGYAVDGCREFMASGEEGTSDALNCAACGCHRNFHRREVKMAEIVYEYTPPNYGGK
ncbi:hypothetical protein SAY87_028370 [Trapa incisa]|uniref:ZF-HD dimerization-type domain-containing protein n=1 Tax=Trapa incisa TaxID=236973 RepID=A0AAN7KUK4_9MYRT|nr:hypothetical protein SAY87_028370 [Trapa incisa]